MKTLFRGIKKWYYVANFHETKSSKSDNLDRRNRQNPDNFL